jgi:NarL family two-component system response regulator LiaR
VEDHTIVRKGLCALLATERDIQVVGEGSNGEEAVMLVDELAPDVILMDLVMPRLDGIEATRQILLRHPDARVLVLTSFAADDKLFPAIQAGAIGYLLKEASPADLVQAIHQVNRGESSLNPAVARKLLHELTHHASHPQPALENLLTERELEVLRLVAQGLCNRDIAARLVITEPTVRTHVSNILSKLHLASRTQAALYALREGLAPAPDEPEPTSPGG